VAATGDADTDVNFAEPLGAEDQERLVDLKICIALGIVLGIWWRNVFDVRRVG
jgi:hypothetical protein